jgi:hypothetical protein
VISPATHTSSDGGSIPLVIADRAHLEPEIHEQTPASADDPLGEVHTGVAQGLLARANTCDRDDVGVDSPPVVG